MKKILTNIKQFKTKDILISLLIIALPFLFYTYRLFPDTQVWETNFFSFNAGPFGGILIFVFFLNIKLLIIFSLIIWYMTCRNWWRNVILIPLVIEIFKLRSLIDTSVSFIDEIEFYQSLPITMPIILLIVFLSRKNIFYSKYINLNSDITNEIDDLLIEIKIDRDSEISRIKDDFDNLKKRKAILNTDEYIKELNKLRKHLIQN